MDDLAALLEQRPGFLAGCVFVFGAIIGSFLNVVVYRLPRGQSLNHPPSRCPRCEHGIRWYHNVPIVGWLLLRGKCFDCSAKISARYPLVEMFTAAMFVGLAYLHISALQVTTHLVADAMNGPSLERRLIIYIADLFVACCLLSASLVFWDGQRVPKSLTIAGIVVALAAFPFHYAPIGYLLIIEAILLARLTRNIPTLDFDLTTEKADLAQRCNDAKKGDKQAEKQISRKGAKDAKQDKD